MVDPQSLRREWEAFSAEWIARSESKGDAAREGLLDDWMLAIIGDVTNLDVIDLGCGEAGSAGCWRREEPARSA